MTDSDKHSQMSDDLQKDVSTEVAASVTAPSDMDIDAVDLPDEEEGENLDDAAAGDAEDIAHDNLPVKDVKTEQTCLEESELTSTSTSTGTESESAAEQSKEKKMEQSPMQDIDDAAHRAKYPQINLGYCCLNESLRALKPSVYTNRTMVKKTFLAKGLPYVSQLALANVRDLLKVLQWNEEHSIRLFRVSSDMFAFWSEYELEDLPDFQEIKAALKAVGDYATEHKHRLTSHPGPYVVLASPNEEVARKSLIELERHSQIFDLMGFEPSYYNKCNIHIRAVYDSKIKAMDRFIERFHRLSENCRRRLCVENDDVKSEYSVDDLLYVHERTGIPITFDVHHQSFCKGKMSDEEAFHAAINSWPDGIRPIVHFSQSQEGRKPLAHSDYVDGPISFFGCEDRVDCLVECKKKDLALLRYRDEIAKLRTQ